MESLSILTGDNHNSRYTRATVSLHLLSVLSLPIPPPRSRSSTTFSFSFSRSFALYMYICARVFLPFPWSPLIASSPCRPLTLSGSSPRRGSRSSCRVGHGYSAIVFELSCSCCGCCGGRFTCLPLPRYFTGKVFLLFLFLSLYVFSSLFRPFCLSHSVSIPFCGSRWPPFSSVSISRPMSHLTPAFLPSFASLSFSKWAPEFMRRN